MSQFIGYHIDGDGSEKSVPVSTGATREEALSKAITRVLILGLVDGYVGVKEHADMSAYDFAKLKQITDDFAAKHGETQKEGTSA